MLVIRMQRTGRKGHAQFRVVVQDSRRTPTSGKIVAALGHFNPHTKETTLDKEKAAHFLQHGAQPSERVIRLLQSEGVKLPSWVKLPTKRTAAIRNVEKRRSTRPAVAEPIEAPADDTAPLDEVAEEVETPVETTEVEESPVAEAEQSPAETTETPVAEEVSEEAEAPAVEEPEATPADAEQAPAEAPKETTEK